MRRTIKRSIPFTELKVLACPFDSMNNEVVKVIVTGHYTLERLKGKVQNYLEKIGYFFIKIESINEYEELRELDVDIFVKYSMKCEEKEK